MTQPDSDEELEEELATKVPKWRSVVSSVPAGAMWYSIFGYLGKWACNSPIVNTYETVSTFAGIGALAGPMIVIPTLITQDLLKNSSFWKQYPHASNCLELSLGFIYEAGALAASAALLGSPVIPTIVPMLIIPAIIWAIGNIVNVLQALFTYCPEVPPEASEHCLTPN